MIFNDYQKGFIQGFAVCLAAAIVIAMMATTQNVVWLSPHEAKFVRESRRQKDSVVITIGHSPHLPFGMRMQSNRTYYWIAGRADQQQSDELLKKLEKAMGW